MLGAYILYLEMRIDVGVMCFTLMSYTTLRDKVIINRGSCVSVSKLVVDKIGLKTEPPTTVRHWDW